MGGVLTQRETISAGIYATPSTYLTWSGEASSDFKSGGAMTGRYCYAAYILIAIEVTMYHGKRERAILR